MYVCKIDGSPVEVVRHDERFTGPRLSTVKCPKCGDRTEHDVPPPAKNLSNRV